MLIIYQLIELETGVRSEPMAVDHDELRTILQKNVPADHHEKFCVLVVNEQRPEQDHDDIKDDRMRISMCPLVTVKTYINLGNQKNVA